MLKPGVRRGSPMTGFSYGLDSGGLTINGGRSQDSLITFDGAVGIRTRANGTSIGTADLDTVQEVQVLDRELLGRVRPLLRRSDPHGDQVRREGFPRDVLRVLPQQRDRCEQLEPQPRRFHELRSASEVQPVRLQHQRSGHDSGRLQQEPRKAVLPLEPGMGPAPERSNAVSARSVHGDAQRQLQRAARSEHLLRCSANDQRSRHGPALPRQHHSAEPPQPERRGVPEDLLRTKWRLWGQQLAEGPSRLAESAQGQHRDRL